MTTLRGLGGEIAKMLGNDAWVGHEMVGAFQAEKLFPVSPTAGRGIGKVAPDAHSADAALLFFALASGLPPRKATRRALEIYRLPHHSDWIEDWEREAGSAFRQIPGEMPVDPIYAPRTFGHLVAGHVHFYRRAEIPSSLPSANEFWGYFKNRAPFFTTLSIGRHFLLGKGHVLLCKAETETMPSGDKGEKLELRYFKEDENRENPAGATQFLIGSEQRWSGAILPALAALMGPLETETGCKADEDADYLESSLPRSNQIAR